VLIKPLDRMAALPEQSAFMRTQYCTDVLQQIIPHELWLQVRTATCKWHIDSEPNAKSDAAMRHYAKR
jgi:hypothetical protein